MKNSFVLKYRKRKKDQIGDLKLAVKVCFIHSIFPVLVHLHPYEGIHAVLVTIPVRILGPNSCKKKKISPNSLEYFVVVV